MTAGKREPLQQAREIEFAPIVPVGNHTSNASISAVVTLVPPDEANFILIQSLDQNAYYTIDGTGPIATGTVTGFLLKADDPPTSIPIERNQSIKVIEATATATIQYQWCK